jgi:hypothetical protein
MHAWKIGTNVLQHETGSLIKEFGLSISKLRFQFQFQLLVLERNLFIYLFILERNLIHTEICFEIGEFLMHKAVVNSAEMVCAEG